MEFITGSYCNDTGGKGDIYSLKGQQEDKSFSGRSNPRHPINEDLRILINQPYEGLGINYLHRMGKDILRKHPNNILNINIINPLKENDVIKNMVKHATDFIPPRRDPNKKLKDLSDRDLWNIAFYMLKNLPSYGEECANHFFSGKGDEYKHLHVKKSILELNSLQKILKGINYRVSERIFTKKGKIIPSSTIDVTDIIKKNFPSLRMSEFGISDIPSNISEIGVFGGIKEVTITGKLEDLSNYTDFSNKWDQEIQPYSLEIELKDWFGVDEDDVLNSETPAIIQRYQLAAFWLLQHQRGYQPFVNTLKFDRHHMYARNVNRLTVF